jgi:predicted nucleotidyltransferase component of viral defense system
MIDRTKHEIVMKKILMDIYLHQSLASSLAFKGGTCLYFFYNLDRFSTDLDFNLRNDTFEVEQLNSIISKYLEISEFREKHFTWFWQGSYEKNSPKIKIEISKRNFPDTYGVLNFYGTSVLAMNKDCMFAHKLCAIKDRNILQNRDLYDALFMFKNNFPINNEIIKIRTGKDTAEYFKELIVYIEKTIKNKSSVLEGLGEVLDQKQKEWAKTNLLQQLIFELSIRCNS